MRTDTAQLHFRGVCYDVTVTQDQEGALSCDVGASGNDRFAALSVQGLVKDLNRAGQVASAIQPTLQAHMREQGRMYPVHGSSAVKFAADVNDLICQYVRAVLNSTNTSGDVNGMRMLPNGTVLRLVQ